MLDLAHPLTRYVFEASRYEDQIRARLVELQSNPSLAASASMDELITGPIRELRRLLHERFDDRPGITRKLDAIESAITTKRPLEEIWSAFLELDELSKDTLGTGFI